MSSSRFSAILTGGCPAPLYDRVLLDTGSMVVTPTLGSIIPHWVLAIPKAHSVNAMRWAKRDGVKPMATIDVIAKSFGRTMSDIIWFEHGAADANSVTGCGVDHAHIHILLQPPFSFAQFCAEAKSQTTLKWAEHRGDAYALVSSETSYFAAGSGDSCLLAHSVEAEGSQFFRRVISRIVNLETAWDYKSHPHMDNVAKTVAAATVAVA